MVIAALRPKRNVLFSFLSLDYPFPYFFAAGTSSGVCQKRCFKMQPDNARLFSSTVCIAAIPKIIAPMPENWHLQNGTTHYHFFNTILRCNWSEAFKMKQMGLKVNLALKIIFTNQTIIFLPANTA